MTCPRLAAFCVALLTIFALSFSQFVATAAAAQPEARKAAPQKSASKSQAASKKSDKAISKKSSSKKSLSKKSASRKSRAAKSRRASKTSARKARASEERFVWLDRAKKSEALTGKASWYGRDFHNKDTASGLMYDMHTFTAAHRTLPIGTVVKVTDQDNGRSVMVCVTDRGPYVAGRIIDLSFAAAKKIGLQNRGVGKVKLEVVSDESGSPLQDGKAYYVRYASDNGKSRVGPFDAFADAAAMQEALSQAHKETEVVLESAGSAK